MRRFKPTIVRTKSLTIAAILTGVCLVAIALFAVRTHSAFNDDFTAYASLKRAYVTAAYKPAAQENPVRQEVNKLLSFVLEKPMSDAERLELSRRALLHMEDIERQIDGIKVEADRIEPLIERLEKSSASMTSLADRETMQKIASLARAEAEIIADIRGLSYRADYYTTEIFERIIDDGGALTNEHVRYLNDLIPQLEEQFDRRARLYRELEDMETEMNRVASVLGLAAE